MNDKKFDVIIIGGGPAGISAALWCDELGLDAVLLEERDELGGQLLWTYNSIENYLGIEAKNGFELRNEFVSQLRKRKFTEVLNSRIREVNFASKIVVLENGEEFRGDFIVIATGVSRRKLGVEGEKEFQGKGILVSGKRDKELVRDKAVLIVGGGDAAFENTQILSETAKKVILVHRRGEFSARKEFVQAAKNNPKVEILTDSTVTKISGNETVERALVKNTKTNAVNSLEVSGVLLRIGVKPNSGIFKGRLETDSHGYISVDRNCITSISGIYAIGDVANPNSPTVSTATGTGATAIKNISFLSK